MILTIIYKSIAELLQSLFKLISCFKQLSEYSLYLLISLSSISAMKKIIIGNKGKAVTAGTLNIAQYLLYCAYEVSSHLIDIYTVLVCFLLYLYS